MVPFWKYELILVESVSGLVPVMSVEQMRTLTQRVGRTSYKTRQVGQHMKFASAERGLVSARAWDFPYLTNALLHDKNLHGLFSQGGNTYTMSRFQKFRASSFVRSEKNTKTSSNLFTAPILQSNDCWQHTFIICSMQKTGFILMFKVCNSYFYNRMCIFWGIQIPLHR